MASARDEVTRAIREVAREQGGTTKDDQAEMLGKEEVGGEGLHGTMDPPDSDWIDVYL